MTPERELWACALHVEREHGETANLFVTERVQKLAQAGDMLGVERWIAIADKLDQLRDVRTLT